MVEPVAVAKRVDEPASVPHDVGSAVTTDRDGSRSPPLCAGCARRIGVYEPIWRVAHAADVERTSWLQLAARAPLGELWHAECAESAGGPAG